LPPWIENTAEGDYLMEVVDATQINSFAHGGQDEQIVEIPLCDLQGLLEDIVSIYNQLAEGIQEAGILRGRELGKITKKNEDAIKAERDPVAKIMLLNAFIKQHLTRVRDALKSRPVEGGKLIQVATKIQARAVQIVDYIKTYVDDDFNGKTISLDSQQARLLFSGKHGEPVSRRDTIRAMRRAEKLWPALACGHRPGDGRQTMRLTAKTEDLKGLTPEFTYCNPRQRSGLSDLKVMFNLG
jgi:hypothetical protein